MRGVAAGYPAFDKRSGKTIDLQDRSNACGVEHQQPVFAAESRLLLGLAALTGADELVALELYLSDRTAGMPAEPPAVTTIADRALRHRGQKLIFRVRASRPYAG
ncbi:MAG: hypothetical protein CTR53_11150 [Ferrovibrio sp.]|nr:hypothetical protein [Ferrovibrio sp.]PJI40222.1 MAG: hypothetical protein CTR53_11150 [Ferrovibrio sp.]